MTNKNKYSDVDITSEEAIDNAQLEECELNPDRDISWGNESSNLNWDHNNGDFSDDY